MGGESAFATYNANTIEKILFNHSFMPIPLESPIYCVWEVKEGVSGSEFRDFIDGPDGANRVLLLRMIMPLN